MVYFDLRLLKVSTLAAWALAALLYDTRSGCNVSRSSCKA